MSSLNLKDFRFHNLPNKAKILIIRLRSLGDLVLNTACYKIVKEDLPSCELSVLVESPLQEVIGGNPYVDNIIVWDKDKIRSSIINQIRFINYNIRRQGYDMVLDMHGGPRSAIFTFFSKAKYRVGLEDNRRGLAYNIKVKVKSSSSSTTIHALEFQIGILKGLGCRVDHARPYIHISEDDRLKADSLLKGVGIADDDKIAVIHPAVVKRHNEWQPDKFALIADYYQQQRGLNILFTCGPNQGSQIERIGRFMKSNLISLAEKTTIKDLASILQRSKFLLCHNSGPMHLGAAMGVPVFALFGPVYPTGWRPLGDKHHVFYKPLPCSPCAPYPLKECREGDAECKKQISAEEVIKVIEESNV
ncbi:MAG: glycosyltransferase family 9 protein [Nitrospinae bacterium]|nr:glycosyltransferase family 9 protein [Nitrospinota bacterium]